jgi:membrane protease subunit (stomatin/prohibitin family)
MGIFDFFSGEFIDVVEWREANADTIIWKFPDRDCAIKNGAQLTVRESQMALFIDEGRFADTFEAGRHVLATENLPILTKLRSWKYGFNSPYKVDIYFVSTKQFPGFKWGTPNPVMLRDPEFKQVRVKAFGTYALRVKDAQTFFKEFAGTQPQVSVADVEDKMRDWVSPKFAEALAEAGVSVMDLVSNYTELGAKIIPLIQADFEPFGLEVVKFQITSTSLPPEVEEFYDKMTKMNMVGDMNRYTQFQTAESIEKAAENPGTGGTGVGLGMGMGMANMVMNQMQQQQQQTKTNQPATETKEQIIALLKELGTLKESGVLTEDEFNEKKKELLARL